MDAHWLASRGGEEDVPKDVYRGSNSWQSGEFFGERLKFSKKK